MTNSQKLRSEWLIVAGYCLLLALIKTFYSANLDHFDDMVEGFAWGQDWPLGTFKHPPFFTWMVHLWFEWVPRTVGWFFALSYLTVALGLAGVWVLARNIGLQNIGATASLLLILAFPYSTLAGKFNANTPLLLLWPWTCASLVGSWHAKGWQGWAWSAALAIFAAAAMLTKYYSGVFLLGLLLTTLLAPQYRAWLLTPRAWFSLVLFCGLMVPHGIWLIEHQFVTLNYIETHHHKYVGWMALLRFMLAPFYYWFPAWALMLYAARREQPHIPMRQWVIQIWRPQSASDVLFWFCFFPWAITLAFGVSGAVELSTPWAIPIGYAFSLLWLRNLDAAGALGPNYQARVRRLFIWLPGIVVALALAGVLLQIQLKKTNYYRPDGIAVQQILSWWTQKYPDTHLSWVGGDWPNNGVMAFYGDPTIRILPGFPDQFPAQVSPPQSSWQRVPGIIFCKAYKITGRHAPSSSKHIPSMTCEQKTIDWLGQHQKPIIRQEWIVHRTGWRFPDAPDYRYIVFAVEPDKAAPSALPDFRPSLLLQK